MLMKKILSDNSNLPSFETIVLLGIPHSTNTKPDGTIVKTYITAVGKLHSITKDGPIWNIGGKYTTKTSSVNNTNDIFSSFDFNSIFNTFSPNFMPTHYIDLTNLKFEP